MVAFQISSPKRDRDTISGWEGFFPYYAGYPTRFATDVIRSAGLAPRSSILDPWNGSGTTTYAAAQLGHTAIGFDMNPVMIVIARARMLSPSEADSLMPLCKEIIRGTRARALTTDEPLLLWFKPETAACLRAIEQSIRRSLVGTKTQSNLAHLSGIAATFYAALFSLCRDLVSIFRSSNPTWTRKPRESGPRVSEENKLILTQFAQKIESMSDALSTESKKGISDLTVAACRVGDSTQLGLQESSIDLVLGSPPYCTRIDYTAATRVELAVISALTTVDLQILGKEMIGSTKVPIQTPLVHEAWGETCLHFLERVKAHTSKASSTYYYKTHLDYFDKIHRSLNGISFALRQNAKAVLVVQDSYYKDVHNPLPEIFTEMGITQHLVLTQRNDFPVPRSMRSINSASRRYRENHYPIESVLCFEKISPEAAHDRKRAKSN